MSAIELGAFRREEYITGSTIVSNTAIIFYYNSGKGDKIPKDNRGDLADTASVAAIKFCVLQ